MLRDVLPFEDMLKRTHTSPHTTNAILAFVQFLEKKLGGSFVVESRHIPYGRVDLTDFFELAESLRRAGILHWYAPATELPDEPRLWHWQAQYRMGPESLAQGATLHDERHAFVTMLAEALERYIWYERDDYFTSRTMARVDELHGEYIDPARFAGFSPEQRRSNPDLILSPERAYTWIQGISLLSQKPLWIPAQTVSAHSSAHAAVRRKEEPVIRRAVTTGLATHPIREEALLGGALEIIERDAYSIMWLNQLTLPRFNVETLTARNRDLERLIATCTQYRLRVHAIRMLTDAPTHAVCVVLEDMSGHAPRFAFGLKAHRDPAIAIYKAANEALRARKGARGQLRETPGSSPQASNVGHYDRLRFWAAPENAPHLSFLIDGPLEEPRGHEWESDTTEEHLARVTAWCRDREYELAAVPFTQSAANIPKWHIEMVILPELHPLSYSETLPHLDTRRIAAIPELYGYRARARPFTEQPHPFA